MTAIARDAVAAAHLVYAWPFPIGPDCEVKCAEDEHVVMCPGWLVGERLGPGFHMWRTTDPTRPAAAYFVLAAPVDVPFDMTTMFLLPSTGQRVRIHASGSLQVRCADPQLLVAQFVGLPFDDVNAGILRSVSRSVERMLARLLTRRVVLAGTPAAVTDPSMQSTIVEELIAYNPAAGAVFGVEMIRMGRLAIQADDGSAPLKPMGQTAEWGRVGVNGDPRPTPPPARSRDIPLLETVRGRPPATLPPPLPTAPRDPQISGDLLRRNPSVPPIPPPEAKRKSTPILGVPEVPSSARATPPTGSPALSSSMSNQMSGEIGLPVVRPTAPSMSSVSLAADEPTPPPSVPPPPIRTPPPGSVPEIPADARISQPLAAVSGEIGGGRPARAQTAPPDGGDVGVPLSAAVASSGSVAAPIPTPAPATDSAATRKAAAAEVAEPRGGVVGIGMSAIGEVQAATAVSGEIPTKVAPGARVLVPGPNGLMQSATVRQLLQGYYELEVGSSGQTIWVPMGGVVPEP